MELIQTTQAQFESILSAQMSDVAVFLVKQYVSPEDQCHWIMKTFIVHILRQFDNICIAADIIGCLLQKVSESVFWNRYWTGHVCVRNYCFGATTMFQGTMTYAHALMADLNDFLRSKFSQALAPTPSDMNTWRTIIRPGAHVPVIVNRGLGLQSTSYTSVALVQTIRPDYICVWFQGLNWNLHRVKYSDYYPKWNTPYDNVVLDFRHVITSIVYHRWVHLGLVPDVPQLFIKSRPSLRHYMRSNRKH